MHALQLSQWKILQDYCSDVTVSVASLFLCLQLLLMVRWPSSWLADQEKRLIRGPMGRAKSTIPGGSGSNSQFL